MNDLTQVQLPLPKQHGNSELHHGDCRQILPTLAERPKFIFADPPFNIGHDYDGFDDSKSEEEYDEFTQQWLHAVEDQLADDGILAVNVPDDLVLPIIQHCRLQRTAWVNWHFRFGQCGRSNWINSKVHCLIFAKNPKSFTWNPDEVLVTSDRASKYNDKRTADSQTPGQRVPFDVWGIPSDGPFWGRVQGNNAERRQGHPNQLPEVYLERLIRAYTNPDDLVLDPFVGSGTTVVVAEALERRSVGIDVSRANVDSSFERLQKGAVRIEGYITHFTTFWRNVMMPEVNADFQVRFLVPGFDSWLRKQLTENTQYDVLVKEILTTPLDSGQNNRRNPYSRLGESSPLAFFQGKQIAPENLAAATSRIFLGIRLECAQCHDHPFDSWKQEDFWSLAAFYGGIERQGNQGVFGRVRELFDRRELNIPGTETVVQAGYLDGTEPQWRFRVGPRETLAAWITAPGNPYFARTAVNRMWGHFFGVGIVDPIDDFTADNPPSHPELLDLLAKEFAAHNFDLKFLIRVITASRTYQLSSLKTNEETDSPQLFARMAVKGLTGEQIYDSVAQATGLYRPFSSRNPFSFGGNDPRGEFLETFANDADATTERQTTILQALAMMNGQLVAGATNLTQSRSLAAVAEFPGSTTAERIENLYFLTLSRKPRPEETERLVKYVERGGEKSDPKKSLGDVFWALLNSSEFMFNH